MEIIFRNEQNKTKKYASLKVINKKKKKLNKTPTTRINLKTIRNNNKQTKRMTRQEEEFLASYITRGTRTTDDLGAQLIESYRTSRRAHRTSYSLNYGMGLASGFGMMMTPSSSSSFVYDEHPSTTLKETRVSQWLRTKPTYVTTSVREREGFLIEPLSTFTYHDRTGLARRNSRRLSTTTLVKANEHRNLDVFAASSRGGGNAVGGGSGDVSSTKKSFFCSNQTLMFK